MDLNTTPRTLTKGCRKAVVSPLAEGRIAVWVGYADPAGDIPALWFKGRRTCSNVYTSFKGAAKAVREFLDH